MRPSFRTAGLVVLDAWLITGAVAVAAWIRFGDWRPYLLTEPNAQWRILMFTVVTQACLYYADLYNLQVVAARRDLVVRLTQSLGAAALILSTIDYWFPDVMLGRGVFLIAAILIVATVAGWRLAYEHVSPYLGSPERLLMVGTSPGAVTLARELFDRRHALGIEIVGFVDSDPTKVGTPVVNPGVVGTIEDIPRIVREQNVQRVVVSLMDARGKLPMEKLLEMKLEGVTFDHLPSVYEEYTGKIAVEHLRPSWLIFSAGFKKSRTLAAVKRSIDVVVALIGLVAALPVMVLVGLAVRLTSKGPVLYRQCRVGLRGKNFWVYKFRTMRQDAESETGPVWASKSGDPRVTPVGGFLRRVRLDELPQLWNILRGEMSLVGPRPERPEFVKDLTEAIPYYGQRHIVRPGLTGWAQVRYTYGASHEDALQKLQYEIFYIKNLSIGFDFYIMFETIKTVLLRKGA